TVDPQAWAIIDDRLYLAHNRYWIQKWREDAAEHIRHADASWPAAAQPPGPGTGGPPRAASPPTTPVARRPGGAWGAVRPQVARDEAGNVVGRGDLGAQIEQVGKNVGACLKAGGASVKDIGWTISYVTDPAEFSKYSDLRLRYFGPPSPRNAVV